MESWYFNPVTLYLHQRCSSENVSSPHGRKKRGPSANCPSFLIVSLRSFTVCFSEGLTSFMSFFSISSCDCDAFPPRLRLFGTQADNKCVFCKEIQLGQTSLLVTLSSLSEKCLKIFIGQMPVCSKSILRYKMFNTLLKRK